MPLVTLVPVSLELIKERTNKGIPFLSRGCNVFG